MYTSDVTLLFGECCLAFGARKLKRNRIKSWLQLHLHPNAPPETGLTQNLEWLRVPVSSSGCPASKDVTQTFCVLCACLQLCAQARTSNSMELPSYQTRAILKKKKWIMQLILDDPSPEYEEGAVQGALWGTAWGSTAPMVAGRMGGCPWGGMADMRLAAPAGTKRPGGRQNILHTEENVALSRRLELFTQRKSQPRGLQVKGWTRNPYPSGHRDTAHLRPSPRGYWTPLWFFSRFHNHGPSVSLRRHEKAPCARGIVSQRHHANQANYRGKRLGCIEVEEQSRKISQYSERMKRSVRK